MDDMSMAELADIQRAALLLRVARELLPAVDPRELELAVRNRVPLADLSTAEAAQFGLDVATVSVARMLLGEDAAADPGALDRYLARQFDAAAGGEL